MMQPTSETATASDILDRIHSNAGMLLQLAEREYGALLERDTRQLESIAADKVTLMQALESAHERLLSALHCSESELDQTLSTMALTPSWQQVKARLKQAQHHNDRNGMLLNQVLTRVQSELSLLTGQTTLSYEEKGVTQTQHELGSLGRA